MSHPLNYDSAMNELIEAGLDVSDGLRLNEVKPHRVRQVGDPSKKFRAWTALRTSKGNGGTYIVGTYGVFSGAETSRHILHAPVGAGIMVDRDVMADLETLRILELQDQQMAAKDAVDAWSELVEPKERHPYAIKKKIGMPGAMVPESGTSMIIALRDIRGNIKALQGISPDGEKMLWPRGAAKRGAFHMIGDPAEHSIILIAEGYATAATVSMCCNLPTAFAVDAGNLAPVAISLRQKYPWHEIIICADDDYQSPGSPGEKAAIKAALACYGEYVLPDFSGFERNGETDFNDLMILANSKKIVERQILGIHNENSKA